MIVADLRHRITIQKQAASQDGAGGSIISWGDFKSIWAQIEPLSGRELYEAQRLSNRVTHKVTVRYLANLTPDMRVKHGVKIYKIISIVNLRELDTWMILLCEEEYQA